MKLPSRFSRRLHRWRKFGLRAQILERFFIDYANSESTSPPLQVRLSANPSLLYPYRSDRGP